MIWAWVLLIVVLIFGLVVFRGAPYVPSQKKQVSQALHELYPLATIDVLVDIGSGDGVVLREAAKIGAGAVGYEINPILVIISRFLSRKYKNIRIELSDFWLTSLPDNTTIVYVFSVTRDMEKIAEWLQKEVNHLNRPVHIITYGSKFDNIKILNNLGAYNLYKFYPLQPDVAQV